MTGRTYNSDNMSFPEQVYASRIRTPDGTILQSFYRHNYVEHVDAISGETYMLDGGIDYCRTSVNKIPAESLAVYNKDSFEIKREIPVWGTYGKSGKEKLRWISVAEMEDDHILTLLEPTMNIRKGIKDVLIEEAKCRQLDIDVI